MIISFASGKGGTGKTTVAINFALSLSQESNHPAIQFLDCDVEEPNAAIFLKPKFTETVSVGIPVPVVDLKKCTYCGKCAEVCAYNAIAVVNPAKYTQTKRNTTNIETSPTSANQVKRNVLIFSELCHGCGGCKLLCPENAISETNREIGIMQIGKAGTIEFIHGKLNIGEPMAPPLIREIKQKAFGETVKRRNGETNHQFTIIDVPPGTSCPVIEAVKGSDFSVLVTEPTPFGLHDLKLAVETLRKINIPFGVVINRDGIGDSKTDQYCKKENIPVLMRIPMDREIAIAYSNGIPLIKINTKYEAKFS
ncbi:ATP-binding protein, partial [candidate division WOR-3 bacterium]|nr:ATP-binding protein [candidate division WOR-3 bacterium]